MGTSNNKNKLENPIELFKLKTKEELKTLDYSYLNKIIKEYCYLNDILEKGGKIDELKYSYNMNTCLSNPINQSLAKNQLKVLFKWIKITQSNSILTRRSKKGLTSQSLQPINYNDEKEEETKTKIMKQSTTYLRYSYNNNQSPIEHKSTNPKFTSKTSLQSINFNLKSSIASEEDSEIPEINNDPNQILSYTNFFIENALMKYFESSETDYKERIVNGIPKGFIIPCWIVINKIPLIRQDSVYEYYLNQEINEEIKGLIIRDLDRTFPKSDYSLNLVNYSEHLFNVLKAYACLDKKVCYCQGMNVITGYLLLMTDFNDIDTFYILISLFSQTFEENPYSIRGFFTDGFPLLLYFKYLFSKSFEEHMPKLFKHFNTMGIPLDVWVCRWIQTLFTIILPLDWCSRVWNCIFLYGMHFIIKFAIILTNVIEQDLLGLKDENDILKYLNNLMKFPLINDCENLSRKCSIDQLIQKAIKLTIRINYYKEKYIRESEPDFSSLLEENKVCFELESSKQSSIRKISFSEEAVFNNNLKTPEMKGNEANRKSIQRTKVASPGMMVSNYENYDEDIEEEIDDLITEDIDLRKNISNPSNKIVQNLRNYQYDFRGMKAELDCTEKHSRSRLKSMLPLNVFDDKFSKTFTNQETKSGSGKKF